MKEATVRIGDKHKSVRIKRYFLEFYFVAMGIDFDTAKEDAGKELIHGLSVMNSEFVTADYVVKRLMTNILEHERFRD